MQPEPDRVAAPYPGRLVSWGHLSLFCLRAYRDGQTNIGPRAAVTRMTMVPEAVKEQHDVEASRPRSGGGTLRLVKAVDHEPEAEESAPGAAGDSVLVARALQGHAEAFEALVRRHLRAAFMAARPLVVSDADAEDVCQDAFIRALEQLEQCRDPSRFRAWLLTIVRNRAHNLRKYERLRETESLDGLGKGSLTGPERDLERSELGKRLSAALSQLTEKQRQVVLLHDYEGWQHAEIGRKLGMSAGASRFSLHAARKKLRALLEHDRPEGTP